MYQRLANINTSIYGTCGKIGGSKPQLRTKQVRHITTPVILDVRKFKQKSSVIKFLNLMNMQTRTFDVEGQKDMILMNCHAACIYLPRETFIPCETLSLRELTMHVLLNLELYRMLKDDAVSGLPSVR